jgi:hypothetical protein
MLNEAEYSEISRLYSECMHATKEFREKHGLPLTDLNIEERFKPVRDAYLELTGFNEKNHNAILHHRLSLLGPDCPSCGKPIRTKKAKFCAECGWKSEA